MAGNRPKIIVSVAIVRVQDGNIIRREPKELSLKHLILHKIKTEYQKRHDEFMTNGGTRVLNTYSDNVALQITKFKQQQCQQLYL